MVCWLLFYGTITFIVSEVFVVVWLSVFLFSVVLYQMIWFLVSVLDYVLILSLFFLSCTVLFFFFKQKTAYEMRISDWSSDVCSSDLSLPLILHLISHFTTSD